MDLSVGNSNNHEQKDLSGKEKHNNIYIICVINFPKHVTLYGSNGMGHRWNFLPEL